MAAESIPLTPYPSGSLTPKGREGALTLLLLGRHPQNWGLGAIGSSIELPNQLVIFRMSPFLRAHNIGQRFLERTGVVLRSISKISLWCNVLNFPIFT